MEMKELLTEWRKLIKEEEERVVFNPEEIDLPVPKKLVKLLDPDITPQKFAQRDAELDDSGKPQEHAFACAAFALTYADNDADQAMKILKMAIQQLPKIAKGMSSSEENKEE
tara:strand:- start:2636 stop:2971 length:336 start_codon:yes stop_codon:yes gene_type:complete